MTALPNRPVVWALGLYKRLLSPWLPPACRFEPTCSAYATDCFRQLPFLRAVGHSLRRLSRCHPFHPGGYDPAPGA